MKNNYDFFIKFGLFFTSLAFQLKKINLNNSLFNKTIYYVQ